MQGVMSVERIRVEGLGLDDYRQLYSGVGLAMASGIEAVVLSSHGDT